LTKAKAPEPIGLDIAEDDLPPAMRKLTDLQRRFIYAMLTDPLASQATWAGMAGYKARDKQGLAAIGHVTAHSAKVVAGLQEFCRMHLSSAGAAIAIRNVLDTAKDKKNPRLAYDASLQILSRIGMGEKSEAKLVIEHTTDDRDMLQLCRKLAAEMGVPVAGLVGANNPGLTAEERAGAGHGDLETPLMIEGKVEPVEPVEEASRGDPNPMT
jgi:hypothetical protein